MADNIDFLISEFKKINIDLDESKASKLVDYYKLLIEWNEKINLTSITEFEDVVLKHFLDSASIVNAFDSYEDCSSFFNGKTIIDVGTGAGFPGVVLKILFPSLKVTLMDSLDKRIKFLNEVISKLSLTDIYTVHGRVEDYAKDSKFRERFDFATARAVASLPVLCEYCIPFVRVGGTFISYKSEKAPDELSLSKNALNILGGEVTDTFSFDLAGSDLHRNIIFVKKVKATPSQYPRKAGTPAKKPL